MTRLLALLTLVCCGAATAAVSPHVQERIVPGHSIGKVRLGMTLEQVKKALGRPEAVIRREKFGFGRERVEYSWSYTTWRVTLRVTGRSTSVVGIRSSIRRERTREGIGVGSLQERVERVYGIDCVDALSESDGRPETNVIGRKCVLDGTGRKTALLVQRFCGSVPSAGMCADRDARWAVSEVGIFDVAEKIPW